MVVAANEASAAAQRGRAALVASSTVWRRPSRDPVQAATPAANGEKSGTR